MAVNNGNIKNLEQQLVDLRSKLALDQAFLDDTRSKIADINQQLLDGNLTPAEITFLKDSKAVLEATGQKDTTFLSDRTARIASLEAALEAAVASSIDSTPRPSATPVKSGSGTVSTKLVDIAANKYATEVLNPTNASLLSSTQGITYTRKATFSKAQLSEADNQYTAAMNNLSEYWSRGETTTNAYDLAKINALAAQRNWELSRDGLEEAVMEDSSYQPTAYEDPFANDLDNAVTVDLDGTSAIALPDLNDPTGSSLPDQNNTLVVGTKRDNRIRLRPKAINGGRYDFFGKEDSVLFLLNETQGAFFPFTPAITMSHKANYSQMSPTHANTDYYSYNNSPAVQIQISGQFSSQNLAEAQYTLAVMHFFRSATKMHFGKDDENAGLPPPMLVLSGYGDFMFNDLDVILTDFNMEMPNDVDYLEVVIGTSQAWVPALTTMNLTCVVQQTPKKQRDEFNLAKFASGGLFNDNKGWI